MKGEEKQKKPSKSLGKEELEQFGEDVKLAIRKFGAAFSALSKTGLTDRAVCLLIRDKTGLSLSDIEKVIDTARNLPKYFLRKD